MTFDAQGDLWIANGGGVNEFSNFGVELSPASGYTNSADFGITAVGIDSSNNVWIGASNNPAALVAPSFAELTNPGGALIVNSQEAQGSPIPQFAADGSGNMWGVFAGDGGFNSVCKVPPYGGLGTILVATCYEGGISGSNVQFSADSQGIAFDGAGGVWVATPGGDVTLLDGLGNYGGAHTSPPVPDGLSLRAAVDGSGNVWVLLTNNTVVEHISAATPAMTPIALGVKNKKLAAKP
jgi:ligand-binding sensor domain-containing protein